MTTRTPVSLGKGLELQPLSVPPNVSHLLDVLSNEEGQAGRAGVKTGRAHLHRWKD